MELFVILGVLGVIALFYIAITHGIAEYETVCYHCKETIETGKEHDHYCKEKIEAIRKAKPYTDRFKGKITVRTLCAMCRNIDFIGVVYDMKKSGNYSRLIVIECSECKRKRVENGTNI